MFILCCKNTKFKKIRKLDDLAMAAEKCSMICLIGAMDRLWFHQIILFPQPISFLADEDSKKTSESSHNSPKNTTLMQEFSPLASVIAPPPDDASSQETDDETETRPTRLNPVSTKFRAQSSSPISARRRSRNHEKLQKTMSSKTLLDLELEEVKGLTDLGFLFEKENLTKRIISLVPGLQRISDECDEEREEILRPYLSEAWVVKRPDSPLMNLRIARVSSAADMKRHLKFWAHTVASTIQQES